MGGGFTAARRREGVAAMAMNEWSFIFGGRSRMPLSPVSRGPHLWSVGRRITVQTENRHDPLHPDPPDGRCAHDRLRLRHADVPDAGGRRLSFGGGQGGHGAEHRRRVPGGNHLPGGPQRLRVGAAVPQRADSRAAPFHQPGQVVRGPRPAGAGQRLDRGRRAALPDGSGRLHGGVVAERENIAIYDRLLPLDLPVDVRQVFENNRAASLFNHLPAFERCAG